jgi:hypothetical protein
MKLKKFWIVATMIMALLVGNALAYDMAEYFPLNQGDEKIYLLTVSIDEGMPFKMLAKYVINGTELINGVETIRMDSMPFSSKKTGFRFVMDAEGLKTYKWYRGKPVDLIYVFDPPYLALPAQFDVGESYETPYLLSFQSIDDGTSLGPATGNVIHSLDLVEDITVAGGTFKDCLKNSFLISWESDAGVTGNVEENYWLARGLGWTKLSYTEYIQYPEESGVEDTKATINMELISATINGEHYGCPAIFALGGDARANDLNTLRKFRDEVLSKTKEGKELIKLYYQLSPVIVRAMEADEGFKQEVKEMVDGVLEMME